MRTTVDWTHKRDTPTATDGATGKSATPSPTAIAHCATTRELDDDVESHVSPRASPHVTLTLMTHEGSGG